MSVFTNWQEQAGLTLSKPSSIKKGDFACQWLENVDMHMYAKYDQNIPCGSRVINIHQLTMDDRDRNIEVIVQTQGSCNLMSWRGTMKMLNYASSSFESIGCSFSFYHTVFVLSARMIIEREGSDSLVECLTRHCGFAGSSLTDVTKLYAQ